MYEDLNFEELRSRGNPKVPHSVIVRLEERGEQRRVASGENLFRADDPQYPLVYVLSGHVEVRAPDGDVLAQLEPGNFSGELGMLLGQTAVADCTAIEPSDVIIVPRHELAELIQIDPAVGDLFVSAFAARRQMLFRRQQSTLVLVGSPGSVALLRLKEFAERSRVPHRVIDPDDPAHSGEVRDGAQGAGIKVIVQWGRHVLRDPSIAEVARALGLELMISGSDPVDVVIVGAGPAGLSAAVYAASEGLSTVLVDEIALGGPAIASSRIENFLGFPTGVSGGDLAFRAELQAVKFGAHIAVPRRAVKLQHGSPRGLYPVELEDGTVLLGRSLVIATGARYRKLGVPDEERFDGAGVFYAATELEALACKGKEVVVVGGGNSAGQAAMFLSSRVASVRLIHRGKDLSQSMSQYLVDRLLSSRSVAVETQSRVVELIGNEWLQTVTIENGDGQRANRPVCGLFVMIGADPCTDWLRGAIQLDDRGFVLTQQNAAVAPFKGPFETNIPGVFAVGDVRSGSVKRVASAVGEGAQVVSAVHSFLASSGDTTIAPQAQISAD